MWRSAILLLAVATQSYAAPQFITFKDGKLGVNFGGYHAGVGLGGLLGGGAGGGLYAEAGTPHGQAARAGLGGAVDQNGAAAGGLYAGATAGGNVKAAAGLSGAVGGEKAAGQGFATAQAGSHPALEGESSVAGSSGISYSGTKTITKGSEVSVVPFEPKPVENGYKEHKEFNFEAANEINAVPLSNDNGPAVEQNNFAQPISVVKEVHVESQPKVVEKHIVHTHYKPHKHHTAYIGGFVGADVPPPPQIQRRVDIGAESAISGGAEAGGFGHGNGEVTYTKEVAINKNPTFFQDIFNIPISTLKAVGSFLSNTAAGTNVSVQKSASIQSDKDSSKHVSSASLGEAHVSVETPSASKIIDDIFAIPINTLGAVNKFLENNVPARKRVQVSTDGSAEPTRVRLGPHARRRANKHVVIVEKADEKEQEN